MAKQRSMKDDTRKRDLGADPAARRREPGRETDPGPAPAAEPQAARDAREQEAAERDADLVKQQVREHPAGTAAGAATGTVVGAAVGMGAGPVGAALGAAAGAVAGALRGSGARRAGEVTTWHEDAYWQEHYASRPYTGPGASYEEWGPAYRYAASVYLHKGGGMGWDEVKSELQAGWQAAKGPSTLTWDRAEPAARDAWLRLLEVAPTGAPSDEGPAPAPSVKPPSG